MGLPVFLLYQEKLQFHSEKQRKPSKNTFGKEEDDAKNDFDCHPYDMSANV